MSKLKYYPLLHGFTVDPSLFPTRRSLPAWTRIGLNVDTVILNPSQWHAVACDIAQAQPETYEVLHAGAIAALTDFGAPPSLLQFVEDQKFILCPPSFVVAPSHAIELNGNDTLHVPPLILRVPSIWCTQTAALAKLLGVKAQMQLIPRFFASEWYEDVELSHNQQPTDEGVYHWKRIREALQMHNSIGLPGIHVFPDGEYVYTYSRAINENHLHLRRL